MQSAAPPLSPGKLRALGAAGLAASVLPVSEIARQGGPTACLPSAVRWAHACNSAEDLAHALDGDAHFVEADVIAGPSGALMAHPPATASDLTADAFARKVAAALQRGRRIGVKVDVKDIAALPSLLDALDRHLPAHVLKGAPLLLNADVLPGPGGRNAHAAPLDPAAFVATAVMRRPDASLSLGFVHGGGYPLGYSREMAEALLTVVRAIPSNVHVTFAASATHLYASAAAERGLLVGYFMEADNRSLTVWGASPAPVSRWVASILPASRTFVDTHPATATQSAVVHLLGCARRCSSASNPAPESDTFAAVPPSLSPTKRGRLSNPPSPPW